MFEVDLDAKCGLGLVPTYALGVIARFLPRSLAVLLSGEVVLKVLTVELSYTCPNFPCTYPYSR